MPLSSSVESAALARLRKLLRFAVQRSEAQKRLHAQELHDQLQSLLTATQFDLAWLRGNAGRSTGDVMRTHAQRAMDSLQKAMGTNSRIIEALRPSLLDNVGLLPAIQSIAADAANGRGIDLRVDFPANLPEIGDVSAITVYRIAEHGLNFLLAHEHLTSMAVTLTLPVGRLMLRLAAESPVGTDSGTLRADTLPLEIDVEAIKDHGGSLSFQGGNGGSIFVELSLPITAT